MSRIDQLRILGVRSFDNTRSQKIDFTGPLTLIVGYNGSGKTTIIECLKYVTTGELPPNSKGGAFIHDPKLCGEKEVLAQVKLSFKSTQGAAMVCTRSLQLTVKKNARSMKTLDGNLFIRRDGEEKSVSHRVAEMDLLMPQYLGVSKAILDSVIFCHQDESLWPLAEPAALKKRFDEIFEALKYTKAVENIKILAKTQKTHLIGFKKDEESSRIDKDRGARMMSQAEKLSKDIDELRAARDALDIEIREVSKKAEEAWRLSETASLIVGQLTGKRIEEKTKEESVQSLRQGLVEMTDSDQELQSMLEQYEERVQRYQDDLQTQKAAYKELADEMQLGRTAVSAKERDCGSYEAQQENYERQMKNREQLIKEAARSHAIRGYDMDIGDAQVASFMERIGKLAHDQNAAFDRARRETQEELRLEQTRLNDVTAKRSAMLQSKESSRQTIAGFDSRIQTLQSQLDKYGVDEGALAALTTASADVESKLQNARTKDRNSGHDQQANSLDSELRLLEEAKDKLDMELIEGTRQATASARLDYVQKELKVRKSSLETMLGAHSERVNQMIGTSWTPATLESEYQRLLQNCNNRLAEIERQRDGVNREREQVEFKLRTCNEDLKAKEQSRKSSAQKIRDGLDVEPDEFEDEIRTLNTNRDVLKSDADAFKRLGEYFDACIKMAKEQKCCRTCTRSFNKDKDVDALIRSLEKERKRNDVSESVKDLVETEENLEIASRLRPDFETWQRLGSELPLLQKEQMMLKEKYNELESQLEHQDAMVKEGSDAKRDIDAMARVVQSIVGYENEIASFETQVKELAAKQQAEGLSRGMEAIQEDLKRVNDDMRAVKLKASQLATERERTRNQLNALELESRDLTNRISTAGFEIKEKRSLEGQIEELKRLSFEQRDSMKSKEEEIQQLQPQLAQIQARCDDIAQRATERDREMQTEVSKINSTVSDLKAADTEIRAYLVRGGPEQLRQGRREVEQLKQAIIRLEEEQAGVVRDVKGLEDHLRNHEQIKRSIIDNQRYRRDARQLQVVREEIIELEGRNAEADRARFDEEGTRWQTIRNRKASEQASVMGQMSSKDESLKQLMADYDTDFKDAAKRHREALIKVETTKACIEDLGRYGGALDQAIMKYHSLKMEEINRIIDELWRKTYQGTDVDTILIRSENENIRANKSYNYRVCMVKSDVEMDMRGRCSAGQKVLASIIIRLALAECFGLNCGLIALDEPTTNLDRDNIRALAESLSEIIKVRKLQKNFQLIVITHDEEFLRYMNCSDQASWYYRVDRNEWQKSQIERKSINEIL